MAPVNSENSRLSRRNAGSLCGIAYLSDFFGIHIWITGSSVRSVTLEFSFAPDQIKKELIVLKRISAICLAIILLLCCAAGAESENLLLSDFEDFILQTESALTYQGKKSDGMPLFAFTSSTAGISMSAVNAVWSSEQVQLTPEVYTASIRNTEAGIRAQYETGGYVLQSFDVENAVEKEYWGQTTLQCDVKLQVRMNDTAIVLFQRTIRITGSCGTYLFSLSAFSSDDLEDASVALEKAIEWKTATQKNP